MAKSTEDALTELREVYKLKQGDTLHTKLIHVSRSGMYRAIDVFIIRDNEPLRMSWTISKATGLRYDKRHDGIGISGCGMDMGFEIVYILGRTLFPKGFEVDGTGRNGDDSGWDNDGGYALKQRWI